MHLGNSRRRRLPLAISVTLATLLTAAILPAATGGPAEPDPRGFSFQGEGDDRVVSLDAREGRVTPSAAQQSGAAALGATSVRWNDFGTPRVLFNNRGYLSGARDGDPAEVARAFVGAHRELFRLSESGVAALEVVGDTPLLESPDLARVRDGNEAANPDVAHVVLFRQSFGELDAAYDGLLTVGVQRDGRVAWVSSSITGDETVSGSRSLGAADAIRRAAADVGLDLGQLTEVEAPGPWATFESAVVRDVQRARLMALPTPTDGVRTVWETTLLKADHTDREGHEYPAAFISYVDAETGEVLLRDNRVDHLANGLALPAAAAPSGGEFSGTTEDAGSCTAAAQRHVFPVAEGNGQVTVTVATTMPNGLDDDITINLYKVGEASPAASQDLLTSPETLTYAPAGGVPAGDYSVEVCEFTPAADSIGYAGLFAAHPTAGADSALPRWRVFPANPNFTDSAYPDADTRELWCWVDDAAECD